MYVIKYSGPFGYLKPWTAVRDSETFSQQFLTPSVIKGLELKLFPELLKNNYISKIIRHRLSYSKLDTQQEQVRAKQLKITKSKEGNYKINTSIINRGVLINPILWLGFEEIDNAEKANKQNICLCRNEDILLPDDNISEKNMDEFNLIDGFELHFEKKENSFLVGFNRFDEGRPMFGWIEIAGNPIRPDL